VKEANVKNRGLCINDAQSGDNIADLQKSGQPRLTGKKTLSSQDIMEKKTVIDSISWIQLS